MADPESKLEAGRRLARDLRSIRRSRSIDMKDVLDATRLAEDVIEQLEDTALLGNPMFNRVYLRSMFGSYAAVLGISNDDVMGALEEALSGSYVGSLAKKYLGERSSEKEAPTGEIVAQKVDVERIDDLIDEIAPSAQAELLDSIKAKPPEESTSDPLRSKKSKSKGTRTPADSAPYENQSEEAAAETPPSPGDTHPSEPKRKQVKKSSEPAVTASIVGGKSKPTVLLPNMSGFLMLVVAGLVLIALIWFAVSWILSSKAPIDDDLGETQTPVQSTIVRPERIVLPDTIAIDLIAHMEALDPIRVQIDRDLRRPYWIEHLDTLSFIMQERVEFEREVDHARILISGFAIPSAWYASSIRAEITRDRTQGWLDSLVQAGSYPPRTFGVE